MVGGDAEIAFVDFGDFQHAGQKLFPAFVNQTPAFDEKG
ncbi:hypothetical protein N875_01110 [Neisseria meningitidis LNP21362]|nr:hypothetical protein N875_01110 [Neisseria meningitidis LNP21362]